MEVPTNEGVKIVSFEMFVMVCGTFKYSAYCISTHKSTLHINMYNTNNMYIEFIYLLLGLSFRHFHVLIKVIKNKCFLGMSGIRTSAE